MMKLSSFGLWVLFSLGTWACVDTQKIFSVGGSSYQIPAEYLVLAPFFIDGESLDNDVSMVALSFNQDKDFSDYIGPNAWLPKSPITAILYAREGTELKGVSPFFSELIGFSINEKHIVEFESSFRIFDGDTHISWRTFPKLKANFDGEQVKAKWIADCIPLGGVKGSDKSRDSIAIPTLCKINIEYRNAILSLSTSEENLLENMDEIVSLALNKVDSWKVINRN